MLLKHDLSSLVGFSPVSLTCRIRYLNIMIYIYIHTLFFFYCIRIYVYIYTHVVFPTRIFHENNYNLSIYHFRWPHTHKHVPTAPLCLGASLGVVGNPPALEEPGPGVGGAWSLATTILLGDRLFWTSFFELFPAFFLYSLSGLMSYSIVICMCRRGFCEQPQTSSPCGQARFPVCRCLSSDE